MTDSEEAMSAAAGPTAPVTVIEWVARVTTVVFGLAQLTATIDPQGVPLAVAVTVSLVLFFGGSAVFLWAFLLAVGRSRDDEVTLAGLIWLSGIAPVRVARAMRIWLVAQGVIAFASAAVRPFSAVAFGILAPMAALGLMAFWGARHGAFAPVAGTRNRRHPDDAKAVEPIENDHSQPGGQFPDSGEPEDPDDFDQLFRRRHRSTAKRRK